MQEVLNGLIPNVMDRLPDFFKAIGDTLIMVLWSGSISFVLGLFLGILITVTKKGGILENRVIYHILDKAVNLLRSFYYPADLGNAPVQGNNGNCHLCPGSHSASGIWYGSVFYQAD